MSACVPLAAIAGGGGCLIELPPSDRAVLLCSSDADCPSDTQCSLNLGQCVVLVSEDEVAPNVDPASVRVSPAVAGPGTRVTVEFDTDEAISRPPFLGITGVDTPIEVVGWSPGDTRVSAAFTLSGDEPEAVPLLIFADLIDEAGNLASQAAIGSVVLDRTPARLSDITTPVALAGSGTSVTLEFTVSEPVTAVTATLSGTDRQLSPDPTATPPLFRFTYETDATVDTEGLIDVTVSTTDNAGNSADRQIQSAFTFDFSPPALSTAPTTAFFPRPGLPVDEISAVSTGTTVRVLATLTEPASNAVSLRAVNVDDPELVVDFTLGTQFATLVDFTVDWPDTASANGAYRLEFTVEDLAGNSGVAIAPTELIVDTEPPEPPGGLVFRRRPWGFEDSSGLSLSVFGTGSEAVAGETVIIYDQAEEPRAELGRTLVAADGELLIELDGVDRRDVYATLVDRGGNQSPGSRVARTIWTGTLDQGLATANPHRHTAYARLGAPAQPGGVDETVRVANIDDMTADARRSGRWHREIRQAEVPPARNRAVFVYDPRRGVVVLYGGDGSDDRTWEWNGETWAVVDESGPSLCAGPMAAYDPVRGYVLVLRGRGCDGLWAWDGTSWFAVDNGSGWVNGEQPRRIGEGAMVWDPVEEEMLVFGGETPNNGCPPAERFLTYCPYVWAWNGESWRLAGQPLLRRKNFGAAYVPEEDGFILFGGYYGANNEFPTTTLRWNRSTLETVAVTTVPPARRYTSMYYDRGAGRAVLLGGQNQSDVWWFQSGDWTRAPTGSSRWTQTRSTYDPHRGIGYGYGTGTGVGLPEFSSGVDWVPFQPATTDLSWPFPFDFESQPAHAPGANALVVAELNFGAYERWTGWSDSAPNPKPITGQGSAAVWDPDRGVVIAFGGLELSANPGFPPSFNYEYFNTTWHFDPGTGTWSNQGSSAPRGRVQGVLIHVPGRGVFLFGGDRRDGNVSGCNEGAGDDCQVLWFYQGAGTWVDSGVTMPGRATKPAMAYHPGEDALWVVGGEHSGNAANRVPLDGSGSSALPTAGLEGLGGQGALFYDENLGAMVYVGNGKSWVYDGSGWTRQIFGSHPGGSVWTVHSQQDGEQLAVRGNGEVFSWNAAVDEVPGHVTQFALAPSGFSRRDTLESLTIRAVAGATSGTEDGLEILLWTSGDWVVVGTSTDGATSTGSVSTVVDPTLLAGAIPGPELTLAIGFRPSGPSTLEPAIVTVDHVEVDATLLMAP